MKVEDDKKLGNALFVSSHVFWCEAQSGIGLVPSFEPFDPNGEDGKYLKGWELRGPVREDSEK